PHGAGAAAIDRLGLLQSVRFGKGVVEAALVDPYAQSELAVVPSLYEGFALPAVEAMACAVPVVATTAGALPEVVGRDGDAGLLVPPGDAPALAAAIDRALADASLRRQLGYHGRARVLERFTWERAAEATVAEYRIASEVLEHIPEDGAAVAELRRVLKPNGRLAVSVPRWFPERVCWALSDEYHSNPGGHVRIYKTSELRGKLETGGLRVLGGHHAH